MDRWMVIGQYPRPLRWWKYFCCFICDTHCYTTAVFLHFQFFWKQTLPSVSAA